MRRSRWRFLLVIKKIGVIAKVCKLKKANGLKKSPRAWFGKFTQTMLMLG